MVAISDYWYRTTNLLHLPSAHQVEQVSQQLRLIARVEVVQRSLLTQGRVRIEFGHVTR